VGKPLGKRLLEDPGGGRITLSWNFREIGSEDGRWMDLAQELVQWWALVLVVSNYCIIFQFFLILTSSVRSFVVLICF
jgi:hypothetical protein